MNTQTQYGGSHQVNLIIIPNNTTPSNIYFQVHVDVFHSKNKKVDTWLIKFLGKRCVMNKTTPLELGYTRKHSNHVSYKDTL